MSKYHWLTIASLLSILSLLLWQNPQSLFEDLNEETNINSKRFPSAYLINTKTTQYNADGRVSHTMTANKATHFSPPQTPEDLSVFEQPILLMEEQKEENSQWHATANFANGKQNSDEVLFKGNVILLQKSNGNTITTITSEELLIKPTAQYAETDKAVMIKNESGVTTAVGMKISLALGTIEFVSQVRSHYEPR